MNEKLGDEIDALSNRLDNIERERCHSDLPSQSGQLNIIIRNLPERIDEDIQERVNNLIRRGLKIDHIRVEGVERKQSTLNYKPGIIVARLKSSEEKKCILENK